LFGGFLKEEDGEDGTHMRKKMEWVRGRREWRGRSYGEKRFTEEDFSTVDYYS